MASNQRGHSEGERIAPAITISHLESQVGSKSDSKKKVEKNTSSIPRNQRSFLYRGSSYVVGCIETFCGRWGSLVASNPWTSICVALLLTALSGGGLYNITFEFRPYKLWVKEPSEFKEVHEWKMKKFPNSIRKHVAIWEADNILTAKVINQMWVLHQAVEKARSPKGKVEYFDVCLKVPSLLSDNQMESESYDYLETVELPPWLSGNKTADEKAIDPTDSPPEYEYYSESQLVSRSAAAPSWLFNFSNKSSDGKPSSHYLSREEDAVTERLEHCKFVNELKLICYEESLLEVWGYNDEVIKSLTDKRVIQDINDSKSSKVTGFERNVTAYLGGIRRDGRGRIIRAQGALHVWYTRVDMDAIRFCQTTGSCKVETDLGSGEDVDETGMEWEVYFSKVVGDLAQKGMPVNLQASYLFGSVHRSALFEDFVWVIVGWAALVLYVLVSLGKPFTSDSRIFPALIGVTCVGLSVFASYGLCTLTGIPYGPLNSVLPVLLIALGVDDMYVILNAWDVNLNSLDLQEVTSRMRKTLHQAGLAITVTSLTDIIAFVVGATTDVPALRYFCVYAAVGITIVYLLQVTLFVAVLALNQRSKKTDQKTTRLPIFTCCSSKNSLPESGIISRGMGHWAKFLLKPAVTTFVLLSTGFLIGGSLCQVLQLQQRFESIWLLPKSSDLYRWFKTMDEIFPKNGRDGFVFFEDIKIPEELPELQRLSIRLKHVPYISRVDAWYDKLMDFIEREDAFKNRPLTKEVFDDALSYFLFSEDGAKYRNDIIFLNGSSLVCTQPAPHFSTFKINFQYIRLEHTNIAERQAAMREVRSIVGKAKLSGYKAPWALSYGQWETEILISDELLRNMIVVLVIVFVMTMVFLASVRAALLVLTCVLATLLEVSALMHLWGLTINTVTCIALVLAIGICVDYAAHITHGFLVSLGSRKYRAEAALKHMGPAVLHGGISTLLAFILLAPSNTFVFISYFKILTGVAVFGLYHALVLLPILLALLGPPPYADTKEGVPSTPTTEDSHSCTTESTNYLYTSNSVTPAVTPQSTTPNSPSLPRSSPSLQHENYAFEHSEIPRVEKLEKKRDSRLTSNEAPPQIAAPPGGGGSTLGSQALQNIKFSESINSKEDKTIEKTEGKIKVRENSLVIGNPVINKDNVLKLYITNS